MLVGYDEQYANVKALFGTEPEDILVQFADRLEPGSVVLDVGAGQGRNAIFLAERGCLVDALEPSIVAVSTIEETARQRRLDIEIFPVTFERFDAPVGKYAAILVFGLIPDLEWPAIRSLLKKIDDWTARGSVVWITGFTTHDPACAQHRAGWKSCGENSFRSPEGRVRTYLEPGQVLELFDRYAVLHHWEGLGPWHRHGDGPLERHGKFETVLSRA